jgi:hypothetical protein
MFIVAEKTQNRDLFARLEMETSTARRDMSWGAVERLSKMVKCAGALQSKLSSRHRRVHLSDVYWTMSY